MLKYGYDFINYVVLLLIATGWLILRFDLKAYKSANMKRETKFAVRLGWGNMILGALLFVAGLFMW